ncbi:OLC1v1020278C1 [Oldenlandia corymbosa var. corymbosa]|uniref:OLC1v1020278C1 n=1 Tax=Oldenlandia corymbosa var. corymbosa TaxID=529605 RepID=A0AAV1EG31_OLDCO|nr:OLC1v1020278C1 [Oldenlandia corymbosa var. corymbosa]
MDDSISPPKPEETQQPPPMASTISSIVEDPTTHMPSVFDWSAFLDFDLDEQFNSIPFPIAAGDEEQRQETTDAVPISPSSELEALLPPADDLGRVRKRDPRLVCSNFLAGRVPCACPELDEQLEQEEVKNLGGPGKKRARTVRLPAGSPARCQVPGCEVDISELKGYHKRHRVCLGCANASSVVLDGQSKRYCQQCGKFHVLSDFDEGKRSCRRKLERHNTRRRRKPHDGKGGVGKEHQQITLAEDVSCDDDTGKDSTCLSNETLEKDTQLESEGQQSNPSSAHGSQDIQNSSPLTIATFSETQIDREKENPNSSHSPSYCDNKTSFSSMCPTGRISFKLYDWNPAEFPRRLRHQIFQWLASMPVELEGYIRPGCTILTMFIAMPSFMWFKLCEEPAAHLHDLVISPGNLLSGRDTFYVYLENMIFGVMKDGNSVIKIKVNERVPKLHYVTPTFIEAGKPLEFVACGSNLLQPNLRFLVSFGGKYLSHDVYVLPPQGKSEGDSDKSNHQWLKICVPKTEADLFGPAFVEVENESGLSNFIPILIGDEEVCAELKVIQQRFGLSVGSEGPEYPTSNTCEVPIFEQRKFLDFVMDVAWLLKRPLLEKMQTLTSTQIRRFNHVLNFLMENESTAILDRVVNHVNAMMDDNFVAADIAATEIELFWLNLDKARDIIYRESEGKGLSKNYSRKSGLGKSLVPQSSKKIATNISSKHQVTEPMNEQKLARKVSTSFAGCTTVPLLNGEVVMSVAIRERPTKSCTPLLTRTVFSSRTLVFAATAATVCLGLCAVVLHPDKVGVVATTIRKCLLENP